MTNTWMRHFLILTISAALSAEFAKAADGGRPVRKIETAEFDGLRHKTNTVILDVRTSEEFKAGHVEKALNVDFRSSDFAKKVAQLDKEKTYLVHCARGGRSEAAVDVLRKAGLTNVLDYTGGFSAWTKAGKPVVR